MSHHANLSIFSPVVVSVPLLCAGLLYAQHSVDYQLQETWQGGYNADIVLAVDQAGPALSGWELSWVGSPEVEYAWNCIPSVDGDRTILQHVWYNEMIAAGRLSDLGLHRNWILASITDRRSNQWTIGSGNDRWCGRRRTG